MRGGVGGHGGAFLGSWAVPGLCGGFGALRGTEGLQGGGLLNGLLVLACPHLGVSLTNRSAEQSKRSAYMLEHQGDRG